MTIKTTGGPASGPSGARRGMTCAHSGGPDEAWVIGVVTSVTSDGTVRAWRDASGTRHAGPGIPRWFRGRLLLAPDVDAEAALAVARARHRPGDPGQLVPFGSLAAVRAALAPLRPAVSLRERVAIVGQGE